MRADADEAAQKFAAANFVPGVTPLLQGMARVLCGDLDGGDAFFADALGLEEERGAPDILAVTLCERSLAAMARGHWNHAEAFASRAHARLCQAGIEDTYATPLSSPRCKPVPPCTAETSQWRAGNSLVPCAFGL